VRAELDRRLGPVRAAQVRALARRLPRTEIVDRILTAFADARAAFPARLPTADDDDPGR
jgi:hypothetical protein